MGVPRCEIVLQAPNPTARMAAVMILVRKDVRRELSVVDTPVRLTPPRASKIRIIHLLLCVEAMTVTWHTRTCQLPDTHMGSGELL